VAKSELNDAAAAALSVEIMAVVGTTAGMTTRVVPGGAASASGDVAAGDAAARCDGGSRPTRFKSSSTKTAFGSVSRTKLAASSADISEICAVPSRYSNRSPSRCQTVTVGSQTALEETTSGSAASAG